MNYDRVITHKSSSLVLTEKMIKQAADVFGVSVEEIRAATENSGLPPRSQNQIPLTHYQGLRND